MLGLEAGIGMWQFRRVYQMYVYIGCLLCCYSSQTSDIARLIPYLCEHHK